ncbi:MAG: flagellar export chaperone FlgN [Deltaproteobacteria bacterium]|nr:flagellar export chaperone FlgN [Deltaproteobacteria bacterium]
MDKLEVLLRLSEKELEVLKEFLKVLRKERESLLSFSYQGIIECNNKKESLLKEMELIEGQRNDLMKTLDEMEREEVLKRLAEMKGEYVSLLSDIEAQLKKNMSLLSFSMDNIRGLLENIIDYVSKSTEITYGKTSKQGLSIIISREA